MHLSFGMSSKPPRFTTVLLQHHGPKKLFHMFCVVFCHQDMEFVDRDAGMSKEEFNKFLERIPSKLRKKYMSMGYTYADIAGADGTIDFMEIDALINKLVEENKHTLENIEVH